MPLDTPLGEEGVLFPRVDVDAYFAEVGMNDKDTQTTQKVTIAPALPSAGWVWVPKVTVPMAKGGIGVPAELVGRVEAGMPTPRPAPMMLVTLLAMIYLLFMRAWAARVVPTRAAHARFVRWIA